MKKRLIINILVAVCIILTLLFANSIVAVFSGNHFETLKNPLETLEKDSVYAVLKNFNISPSILEKTYFEGWAFCETKTDNFNKEIGLLLSNDKLSYLFIGKSYINRQDIKNAFPDHAHGLKHGFGYMISTIPVADGTYNISIYCKENEENYGLAPTEYVLVKRGHNTEIKYAESHEVRNLCLKRVNRDGHPHIDKNERDSDGNVTVKGWAFIPERSSDNQNVFVVFHYPDGRSLSFNTYRQYRPDVATHFSNNDYVASGFIAFIPAKMLEEGEYEVSILIQDENGNLHTSPTMLKNVKVSAASAAIAHEVDDLDLRHVKIDGHPHLDKAERDDAGNVAVKGWAFVPERSTDNQNVFVVFHYQDGTSVVYNTQPRNRPDVAEHFENDLYASSGFVAKIPAQLVREGDFDVSVLIQDEDGLHTSRTMFEQMQAAGVVQAQESRSGGIMGILAVPLNALMRVCYRLTDNYALAIILFTILTKIILFPISMWTQRNSIKMVEIMPAINELKIQYFGDKETIAEETQKLYKRVNYHPLASSVPMLIQIVLLMGVINAVKDMIGSDAASIYAQVPARLGGASLLMPLGAGLASVCLGLAMNRMNPLQKEQDRKEQIMTNAISIGISLFLGAFVSIGTCVYWIASNLLSIPNQLALNKAVNPAKYIDYAALNESREKLKAYDSLSAGESKEEKQREKEDYKRFFSIVNKHLVFYSESSGFYKYYKSVIEYLLNHTNLTIHYITSDPNDAIFELAKTHSLIKPYYIGEKRLITLMMKMDADIVAMTMPDIETYHIKRSYVRKDIEYVYIPHGMGSTNLTLTKTSTDCYDTVFCSGKSIVQEEVEREKVFGVPKRKLLEIGYPLLDEMRAAYRSMEHASHQRPSILIAPSWQKDNIVDSCLEGLLDQLKGRGYDITVRPHPQEVRHKKQYMETLKEKYQKDGITVQTDFSSNSTVFEADLLITDWSDISMEYAFTTDKPVLFIDTPMKIMNPDYQQIDIMPINIMIRDRIGKRISPSELEKVPEITEYLLSHSEHYKEAIEQLVHEQIYHLGESASISAQYLIKQIQMKISEKRGSK